MPPKKATTTSKSGGATHASYRDMIKDAIINLKDRTGSSRQALKKYVQNNNPINITSQSQFDTQFNRALRNGVEKEEFLQPKGPSGPVKLVKKDTAKPAAKPAAKKTAAAKTATKKTTTTTTTKKAAPKTTTAAATKKAAPKKAAAAGTKANITKQRKAPAPPAVIDQPKVISHTKSGRVTKTTAPPVPKKAAAAPKKRATTTTKKATPRKSEA